MRVTLEGATSFSLTWMCRLRWHQLRMLMNASFSKQRTLLCIGTVSSQQVTSIPTFPTRCLIKAMTCKTRRATL